MATTLCARCGASNDGRPVACAACGEDPLVAGRYLLVQALGRGASGVTWSAIRQPDGARVCLKELRWDRMGSLEDEERFHREAQILKSLDHPRIPRYLDELAWPSEPGPRHALWLVQELVDGESLELERARRRYRLDDILAIGVDVASALDHLAALRPPVVHRDIKPSNLVRSRRDGAVVVVDFGSARPAGLREEGRATVAGTFGTMAPEQLRGEASPASDVYGLGMTLASLCAGAPPEALLDAGNRPDLDRVVGLPSGLRAVLEDMLAQVPSARPTAAEVARRLTALRHGERPAPRAQRPARSVVRALPAASPAPRRGSPVVAVAALIGVSATGLAGFLFMQAPAPPPPQVASSVVATTSVSITESHTTSLVVEPPVVASTTPEVAPEVAPAPPPPPEPTPAERAAALETACTTGDGAACARRGSMSFEGDGVPRSEVDGRAWYVRACEAGDVETCARSGRMLVDGHGGRIDAKLGVAHLERACAAGDQVACMNIGVALARGQGIPADRARALAIFEEACQAGQSLACQNLDGLVGNDWGLPTAPKARYETLTRLCDRRIGTACVRAGDAAKAGRGTTRDAALALDFWRRGCNLGVDDGCRKAPAP